MEPESASTSLIDRLLSRASVREYDERPVATQLLQAILRAARQAPTASNLQAYSLIVVSDPAIRRELAAVAGHQQHVVRAPVFLVVCADLARLRRVCASAGRPFVEDQLEIFVISAIDASLVGMCAALAADSFGLGSVMIGGIRNDPCAAAKALNLPAGVLALFGVCIGWPKSVPPPKPRLPEQLVVHEDRYNESCEADVFARYQAQLVDFHEKLARAGEPWIARVAQKVADEPRARAFSAALAELGFNLC